MKTFELLLATSGKLLSGNLNSSHKDVVIDSRKVKKGDVFVALAGKRVDGHDFIENVIKKGATCVVVSKSELRNPNYEYGIDIIYVKDTRKALQQIAGFHRSQFNIPVIGITGSSGKTTTKDMLASVLSQKFKTLKSEENQNNEIGVPLTLLKLKKHHQAAVVEMAMQKIGEIDELAQIVRPTIAIITNIGEAHLKYLKSKQNVAAAKSEILNYLKKGDYAILPADDQFKKFFAKKVPTGVKIKYFGIENIIGNENILKNIPLPGRHNIYNAMAVIQAARILGVNDKSISKGIKTFKPSSNRMEFIKLPNGAIIINDSYNANPSSMKAALLMLAGMKGKRKIALLGDMLELGRASKKYHKEIGNLCRKLKIDLVFTVGKNSKLIKGNSHFKDAKTAANYLKTRILPRDIILVKGSRGINLDAAVVEWHTRTFKVRMGRPLRVRVSPAARK